MSTISQTEIFSFVAKNLIDLNKLILVVNMFISLPTLVTACWTIVLKKSIMSNFVLILSIMIVTIASYRFLILCFRNLMKIPYEFYRYDRKYRVFCYIEYFLTFLVMSLFLVTIILRLFDQIPTMYILLIFPIMEYSCWAYTFCWVIRGEHINEYYECVYNLNILGILNDFSIQYSEFKDVNNVNNCHNCSICLVDFTANDNIAILSCFHIYHQGCIIVWLYRESKCPICRTSVQTNRSLDVEIIHPETYVELQHIGPMISAHLMTPMYLQRL